YLTQCALAAHQRQVAGQYCARFTEGSGATVPTLGRVQCLDSAVKRRVPASRVGTIEDVVVHQGRSLEEFDGGRGAGGRTVVAAAVCLVGREQQQGPESLAPRSDLVQGCEQLARDRTKHTSSVRLRCKGRLDGGVGLSSPAGDLCAHRTSLGPSRPHPVE